MKGLIVAIPSALCILLAFSLAAQQPVAPTAPHLQYGVRGNTISATWSTVDGATGYRLYYAPFPSATPIGTEDLGKSLSAAAELPTGSSFYLAVAAYNQSGEGPISNIVNFTVRGIDAIEIANPQSDIAAIVYGSRDNSLVMVRGDTPGYNLIWNYSEGAQARLVNNTNGRPGKLEIGGYKLIFSYLAGHVLSELTAPDGSIKHNLEPDKTAGLTMSALMAAPCIDGSCIATELRPLTNQEVLNAIELEIHNFKVMLSEIKTCTAFWWMPPGTCTAIGNYVAETEELYLSVEAFADLKVRSIQNSFNCAVGSFKCAEVSADKAFQVVAELNLIGGTGSPAGGFNITEEGIAPIEQEWVEDFRNGSFTMTDVPCAESVFANIRPECGGAAEEPVKEEPVKEEPVKEGEAGGALVAIDMILETDPDSPVSQELGSSGALSHEIVAMPSNGTLTMHNPVTGAFTYTPHPGFSGTDSFRFVALNGSRRSEDGTVEITVRSTSEPTGKPGFDDIRLCTKFNSYNWLRYSGVICHFPFGAGKDEGKALSSLTTYNNGRMEGMYRGYWSDGTLRVTGNYSNGERNGTWYYYSSAGELEETEKYVEGVLQ